MQDDRSGSRAPQAAQYRYQQQQQEASEQQHRQYSQQFWHQSSSYPHATTATTSAVKFSAPASQPAPALTPSSAASSHRQQRLNHPAVSQTGHGRDQDSRESSESNTTPGHGAYPRLRSQSNWIQLPSVGHALSLYAEAPPREPLFSLAIRQQPRRGLAIGSSQMALRSARSVPLDPPPVLELVLNRSGDEHALSLPEVFVRSQLVRAESPYAEVSADARRNEALVGDTLQSPFNSRIESREDQCFFVFKELGVRTKGIYRIRFDLFDRVGLSIRRVASVYSDAFEVFERRKHPGLAASSSLMDALVDRGMKYKLRKPINPKVAGKKRKTEQDDVFFAAESQQRYYAREVGPSARADVADERSGASHGVRGQHDWSQFPAAVYSREERRAAPDASQSASAASWASPRDAATEWSQPAVSRWTRDSAPRFNLPEAVPTPSTGARRQDPLALGNGNGNSLFSATSASTGTSKGVMLPPMQERRRPTPPMTERVKASSFLRRPSLPERNSSSSTASGSSSGHSSGSSLRPSSSMATSVTPSPLGRSVGRETESPHSSGHGVTKLPPIASLVDTAEMAPSPPGGVGGSSNGGTRSPPWLSRPFDGLYKRRGSDLIFPGRPF